MHKNTMTHNNSAHVSAFTHTAHPHPGRQAHTHAHTHTHARTHTNTHTHVHGHYCKDRRIRIHGLRHANLVPRYPTIGRSASNSSLVLLPSPPPLHSLLLLLSRPPLPSPDLPFSPPLSSSVLFPPLPPPVFISPLPSSVFVSPLPSPVLLFSLLRSLPSN